MEQVKVRVRNDPEVRRAQILDEAIHIIGERGYYGFAVQDLAKRCGITTGGLLYHFNTKEELLLAVLRECDRRWEEKLVTSAPAQHFGDDPTSRETVLAMFRQMATIGVEQPELIRLLAALLGEALDPKHPAYAYLRQREAYTLDGYALLVAAHSPRPKSTARQILALANGLEQHWLREDRSFDLVAEWDIAIATILPEISKEGRDQ